MTNANAKEELAKRIRLLSDTDKEFITDRAKFMRFFLHEYLILQEVTRGQISAKHFCQSLEDLIGLFIEMAQTSGNERAIDLLVAKSRQDLIMQITDGKSILAENRGETHADRND